MRQLGYFVALFFLTLNLWAAKKGVINSDETDIYLSADFDSDIIETVHKGETFLISDKTYGPFYKIKLKSGKIGYIPDNEVNVNGKPFKETPFRDSAVEDAKKNKNPEFENDEGEENEPFDFSRRGFTAQIINYREDTMGAIRSDDLIAIGYKSISDVTWEVIGAFKAPRYYAEKTGGDANGVQVWADYGINNTILLSKHSAIRDSGGLMAHASQIKVSAPSKSYDLQDLSLGVVLDVGLMLQFKKVTFDLSAKYFFDRNNYGGVGLSLLF